MKHVKLFEAFVNEAKVNTQDFADMFAETMANIEGEYDYKQELSTEHLLYMLECAWSEVAEQNNFDEMVDKLGDAYVKFKIQRHTNFMNTSLRKEAEYFGANAYGATGYHLEGMVDCFCGVLEEFGLVKKPLVKKIRKFLLDVDESVVNEEAINERLITKPQQMADEFDSVVANLENEYGTEVNSGDAAFMMQWMWERMCMSTPALAPLIRDQFNKRRIPTRGNFKAGRGATRNDLADAATALGGRALFFRNSKGAKSLPITFEMMRLIASNWDVGTPADWDAIEKLAYKNLR